MSTCRVTQVRGPSLPFASIAVALALLSGCSGGTPVTSPTDPAEAVGDGQEADAPVGASESDQDADTPTAASEGDQNFLIDGYPLDTVPLHEMTAIQSSSFFVNTEPDSGFGGNGRTYYNVVFSTAASQLELLDHYVALFDEMDADGSTETRVLGTIGNFDVMASHYGDGDTAYLQVYLPDDQESTFGDEHFSGSPMTFEPTAGMDQREASIRLIDQQGGEVWHSVYYDIADPTTATFTELEDHYAQLYGDATAFTFDRESGRMSWEEQGYAVNLNFTPDQGRIFLNVIEAM